MAHLECPECGVVFHGRYAMLTDFCPRCLLRDKERVHLEVTFDGFSRRRRFAVEETRSAPLGATPLREPGAEATG